MSLQHTRRHLFNRIVLQSFYLFLSSAFACGLLVARIWFSHQLFYTFLVWNLVLAWAPYVFGQLALCAGRAGKWGWFLVAGGLWLLFFPNAPYIVTDFMHLSQRPPIPLWYDVLLLAAFSWTGLALALCSLSAVHAVVRERIGVVLSWLFAATALAMGSLGIYLGRFLRWNSWDVFAQPKAILVDFGTRLLHPLAHRQTYAVTLLFAVFLFICYLPVAHSHHRHPSVPARETARKA